MAQERTGVATLKGNPLTLLGPELNVGDAAPQFTARKGLADVSSADYNGTVRIISSVPSLDTPVCDAQTRRFNEEASALSGVKILTVSMDLPFAVNRFCETAGIQNVEVLSDYNTRDFGQKYGVLIKEHNLDMRAIFVVDANNTIVYKEIVPEMTEHPNYDAALAAARTAGAAAASANA
ncbi:MAG: thiol peroxidase [Nitrospirota bacterium]|nr:thiol peroxidase [Nitrospirota bacterium]